MQTKNQQLTIRVSSLPSYPDCPRRGAAKTFYKVIESKGYTLRKLQNSVGAAIGTGVHAGAAYILNQKLKGEQWKIDDVYDLSLGDFRKESYKGLIWDNVTARKNDAENQVRRLSNLFNEQLAPVLNPEFVEHPRKAVIAEGWILNGRPDIETLDDTIRDWKTGSASRPYFAQHGGYSLLRRSLGLSQPKKLYMDHLQRVPLSKPQPAVHSIEYDVAAAERAAWAVIGHIMRDMNNFLRTGDPWAFPCNPMSMMCSVKYCPAFGTTFCELVK